MVLVSHSEYEGVDDVGELGGECAPEVDDGEEVTNDENVQTPMCMPSPRSPTAAGKALHNLTHMPYHPGAHGVLQGDATTITTGPRRTRQLALCIAYTSTIVSSRMMLRTQSKPYFVGRLNPVGTNRGSMLAVPVNAKGPTDQQGFENLGAFICSHNVGQID